jgi:hypothetical protein
LRGDCERGLSGLLDFSSGQIKRGSDFERTFWGNSLLVAEPTGFLVIADGVISDGDWR